MVATTATPTPTVYVPLPWAQIVNSDVGFIATAVKKALKEQLDSQSTTRMAKTLEGVDYGQFLPDTLCQFTRRPKDLVIG